MEPKYIVKRADLEYNIRVLRNLAKGKVIWGVVKGNGYGLGIVPLARILNDCGVDHLAVASLAEARTLREAGFTENPILMLRGSADPQEVEELLKLGVTLSLGSREDYFTLKRTAERLDVVADVHLELDTGMGRYGYSTDRLNMKWLLGFYWEGENPHIHPTGIYTHFHTAGDRETTKRQYREFRKVIDFLQETKCDVGMIHCCNSTAFWYYPEYHEDAVRLGSAILGRVYWAREAGLRRVGWVEAPIQEIHYLPEGGNVGYGSACIAPRRTELAVVGVGYYHGFAVERGYDVFRPQDCIRGMLRYLKYLVTRHRLQVVVGDRICRVMGHVGMLNLEANVTGMQCRPGDPVLIPVNPLDLKGMEVEYR